MDNPETLATFGNHEWTIQRHWQHLTITNGQPRDTGNIGQSRMDKPETLATLGNHEWTTQRHWQHRAGRWFSPGTPFPPPIKLTATI